jgi:hypothetical protein
LKPASAGAPVAGAPAEAGPGGEQRGEPFSRAKKARPAKKNPGNGGAQRAVEGRPMAKIVKPSSELAFAEGAAEE